MKKIILVFGIVALLSGCGEQEEMMMTCTRQTTTNGLTSGTEYLVTYTDDEVSHVKITYNYNQDNHTDGVGTGTDGTTIDGNEARTDNDNRDGVIDANSDNDGIVDGVVGNVTDMLIGGIYDTVLDLSGLKDRHTNQINSTNINGFTTRIENNTNNSYKVVYDLDLTKISDTDISRFNVNRSYKTLRKNYTDQGLTCK